MKTKISAIGAATLATLATATPAFAHGDHSEGLALAFHWLSSPAHAFFTLVATVGAIAVVYQLMKKRA